MTEGCHSAAEAVVALDIFRDAADADFSCFVLLRTLQAH